MSIKLIHIGDISKQNAHDIVDAKTSEVNNNSVGR